MVKDNLIELSFYSLITARNILLFRICCENVMYITFLDILPLSHVNVSFFFFFFLGVEM